MHNVDSERERTYNLAGSVDAQIKSLAAELREVREWKIYVAFIIINIY